MKKIFNILLVLVMLLTIVPVNAAGNNKTTKGSIKINNAVNGETYTIYKIFDLASYSAVDAALDEETNEQKPIADAKGYAYVLASDSKWVDFFKTGDGKNYITLTEVKDNDGKVSYYVPSWIDEAKVTEFVEAALAYATKTSGITSSSSVAANNTVSFTNLELGYYLIDSTVGQFLMLNTTAKDLIINEKNSTTDIDKEITEDTSVSTVGDTIDKDNTGLASNSASIGDVITYKTTMSNVKGVKNLGIVDEMTEGLTFNKIISVTLYDGEEAEGVELTEEDYTFTKGESGFTLGILDSVTKGVSNLEARIEVVYTAEVNKKAETVNGNTVTLIYGDKTVETGKTDETKTYVYEFNLLKTDDAEEPNPLTGAYFNLLDANKKQIKLTRENGVYRVIDSTETSAKTNVTIEGTGLTADETKYTILVDSEEGVKIEGLENGTYYLREIKAPDGYTKLASDIDFTIDATVDASGEVTYTVENGTAEELDVTVVNTTGTVLPSTGGMGTVLFITIGSLMVLGFGVLLVTKFRMSKELA